MVLPAIYVQLPVKNFAANGNRARTVGEKPGSSLALPKFRAIPRADADLVVLLEIQGI